MKDIWNWFMSLNKGLKILIVIVLFIILWKIGFFGLLFKVIGTLLSIAIIVVLGFLIIGFLAKGKS